MKWLMVLLILVAATAQAEIYRWRDGRGTIHYTNSEYEIPARYRSRATVLNLGLPPAPGAQAPATPGATSPSVALPAPAGGMPAITPVPVPSPAAAPAVSPQPVPRAAGHQRPPRQRHSREED